MNPEQEPCKELTCFNHQNFLFEKYFKDFSSPLPIKKLLIISDFACRHIFLLQRLLQDDPCNTRWSKTHVQELQMNVPLTDSPKIFASKLRQFRHRHFLRLYLRELAQRSTIEETMTDWSECADSLIKHTLNHCHLSLSPRYGNPRDALNNPSNLHVIAMGKLGGQELNFSSDVDLIFTFSKEGHTDGSVSISNQEYFNKIVQNFIQLMQTISSEGLVFRVDLRLRPNGDSGPLTMSVAALETYYQEQGRDWERYAMVKARLLKNTILEDGHWFNQLITPFVYRRYVDFSVIESLRCMKQMIEREVRLAGIGEDIKRGKGGIREIEFIIQCFQLIRGGRLPSIQQQNALLALNALKNEGLLAHTDALKKAYLFLRQLENALQAHNDQQTHALPMDETTRLQIAESMNQPDWTSLTTRLQQYRRIVSLAFQSVLGKADIYEDEKRVLAKQFSNLWQGQMETNTAVNFLTSLGFQEADRCYQLIHAFRHSPRCRRLSQAARMRLDRFMVLLMSELIKLDNTDAVLLQVLRLLESIATRSAYLALLTENPLVLQELLLWFSNSPFITSLMVNQPFLLEVLVDQDKDWKPHPKKQIQKALKARLAHCTDDETHNETLRQFKLTCWLLAARAELQKSCDAMRIGRFLADVAEVIIAEVVNQACTSLSRRHPQMFHIQSRFAIIAYGKLGGRELNYESDVDLVFLHSAKVGEEQFVTRLTQKIIRRLMLRTQSGILYSVDTRLRPSGSSGLLVSPIDAFLTYQIKSAWTWEHQALLRARIIYAPRRMTQQFNQLKLDVLFLPRDLQKLIEDVQKIRAMIQEHLKKDALKYAAGGLLDLEFLVQFLCLTHPHKKLIRNTHTLLQLQNLLQQNVLSTCQYKQLKQAFCCYHQALHKKLLRAEYQDCSKEQQIVLALSKRFFKPYP